MKSITVVFRKETKKLEVYTSIKGFIEHNPGYEKDLNYIHNVTSRKKLDFEDDRIILSRCPVLGRIKPRKSS